MLNPPPQIPLSFIHIINNSYIVFSLSCTFCSRRKKKKTYQTIVQSHFSLFFFHAKVQLSLPPDFRSIWVAKSIAYDKIIPLGNFTAHRLKNENNRLSIAYCTRNLGTYTMSNFIHSFFECFAEKVFIWNICGLDFTF